MTPQRVRRGRRWRWSFLPAAIAMAAISWWFFAPRNSQQPNNATTHGRNAPQTVNIATIARGDVRVLLDGLGTVTPLATITIRTQINGQLQQVAFTEGQIVHQGDFLAQIDPRPYQVALEQAQGALARDQALLHESEIDLARYRKLLKQDSIAEQQVDTQTSLVRQYQGTVTTDQGAIDSAQLNLAYCHITAPVSGRVGLRQVDPGNYVQTSDTNGLVVLTQLQPISVIFSLPEDDVPQIEKQIAAGATLLVLASDRSDSHLLATGTLATLDNQIDTTTGTVRLRANFDNADHSLFPNQFVNSRLLVETHHGVIVAPGTAIQRGAPGVFAYVVQADNTVALRKLGLGAQDGDKVEVQSGLAEGDKVVTDGADRLRDGMHVVLPRTQSEAQPNAGVEITHHRHRAAQTGASQ
jgi:multidrug efflux system membrane fusion protein